MPKLTLAFIIIILSFANSSFVQYPVFILFTMLLLVRNLFSRNLFVVTIPPLSWHDAVPLTFLICWLYGVGIGLLYGNNINYIFANFTGMIFYAFYFVLIKSNISKDNVLNSVLIAATINLVSNVLIKIYQIIFGLESIDNNIIVAILGTFATGSSTGQSRLLNINQLVIFALLSVLLYRVFVARYDMRLGGSYVLRCNKIVALLLITLSLYVLVIMSASKGYMLAVLFLFAILSGLMILNKSFSRKSLMKIFVSVVVGVLFFVLLASFQYSNIIAKMFAQDDEANIVRYVQLANLLDDITFFGKGLGAVIIDVVRNEEKPYGFELSYVNVIHKIGIFSVPLFICYCYSLYKAITELKRKRESWRYSAAALGALCYLFPALGNPILFSPQMVMLHCVALYLLRPI